jgi:hypothetical protein
MAGNDETIHHSSQFGTVATHPSRGVQPFLVAPTTASLFNVLGLDLVSVACLSLHDILFAFDSSFVTKSVTPLLEELPGLRESHKNKKGELPRISIFGHADPVGDDELNKALSGRRATAVFGLVTQDVGIWRKLLNHPSPFGDDNWRTQNVTARMRAVVGSGPKSEDDLIKAYLAALCPFQLKDGDFLGDGTDPDHKADVQGCSSFNPNVILSEFQDETEAKAVRDSLNQVNRRVVIFLFRAGTKVNPKLWPCPTASQTTTQCRARFFGPPVTGNDRRRPDPGIPRIHVVTDSPDVDALTDTYACRFYSRVSHLSPCEGRIVPVIRSIHVFLKLVYKDPVGTVRNFPADVPIIVDDGNGTVMDVKSSTGGLVDFIYDRDLRQFTLRFELGDGKYIVSPPEGKGPGPERLLTEQDIPNAIKEEAHFFKVPPKWSLADSDWTVESPNFSKNFFRRLDDQATTIGILENPVRMTLDPHWQYLRFAYFDRVLKKNLSIPPIPVEAFRKASGSGSPDTRSNWTVQPDNRVQCLPWILRVPSKPDKDTLVQFRTDDDTFIDANEKDGSRKVVSGTKHDKPDADRLRFYDLPKLWKSSHYFARFSSVNGVDTTKDGFYEKVAEKPTSLAQPMMFSLDDMVLTDAAIKPIAWTAKDRVAIFKNTFSDQADGGLDLDLSEVGVFEPDDDNKESYLTKKPLFDTGGNYIAEYPEWTRLLVMKGNLFDVFDRRTTSGQVIGARAAVRWVESASKGPPDTPHPKSQVQDGGSFFTMQAYFEQSHRADLDNDDRIGRFDLALLRCCEKDGDVEVAVALSYLPYHFDFKPPPDPNFPSQGLGPPLSSDKTAQQEFANDGVRSLMQRWNGLPEPLSTFGPFGPGPAQLLPDDKDTTAKGTAPKLRAKVVYFAQSLPRILSHVSWGIFESVRASAGSDKGRGSLARADARPAIPPSQSRMGEFTFAHETGHIGSLGDEYIESQLFASTGHPGIASWSPGSAYAIAGPDMMQGNFDISPRYCWHIAEWFHSLKPIAFPFFVKQGSFDYRIPHHPDLPLRSFVYHPIAEQRNASNNGSGMFDVFLFAWGDEPLTVDRLPASIPDLQPTRHAVGKFDAIMSVVVKFKIHVYENKDDLVHECANGINEGVFSNFDSLFTVKGSVKRKFFTGDGTFSFNNAYVIFQSRFLVENFPQDAGLRKAMKVTTEADYQAKVQGLGIKPGVHVEIRTVKKGTTHWDVKPEPPSPGKQAPRGRLIINHDDLKNSDAFKKAFRPFFWNILGFADTDPALPAGSAQVQVIARQVIPDATVTVFPTT